MPATLAPDALTADILDERDPVTATRDGLNHGALEAVRGALFGTAESTPSERHELAQALGVSGRTLDRRRGGRLSPLESDRLLLVAETFDLAVQALDNADRARAWLFRPHALLGGETPMARLDTLAGAREVQSMLRHIEYGMAA